MSLGVRHTNSGILEPMRSNHATWTPAALGLALTILALAPVLADPSGLALGLPCGAAPAELWSLWSFTDAAGPDASRLGFPAAPTRASLTAPAAALIFGILSTVMGGTIMAWNTVIALGLLTLTLGTLMLGRLISPTSPVLARFTLVLAVVGCSSWSPMLRELGLGAVPMMTMPLALALTLRWIEPQANRWLGVAAAAVTAFSCLGHWSTSVFVIAILVPMVCIQCRNFEGVDVWRRALIALAPGLVLGAIHIALNSEPTSALSIEATKLGAAWIHHMEGALLLPATAATALPALGMLLLTLAGAAARPSLTAGWLLVGAWGTLLAAGMGPAGFETFAPAHQLSLRLPPLAELGSWWGIAPLVALPFGLAAMIGVEALHKVRRERLAMGVLLLALVDQTLPTVTTSGPQVFSAAPSEGVVTALSNLPPGGVLQLPVFGQTCASREFHRLWQRTHDRPVSTAPPGGADGGLMISYLARLTTNQAHQPQHRASTESPIDPSTFLCAKADIATLTDLGFTAVVLDHTAGTTDWVTDTLTAVLGAPVFADKTAALWSIRKLSAVQSPAPCALPVPIY
jgi:hypothetical protein